MATKLPPSLPVVRKIHQIQVVADMIELGARSKTIRANCPVTDRDVRALRRAYNLPPAKKGLMPSSPNWFVESKRPPRVIHSSIFANLWFLVKSENPHAPKAETFVTAYKLYKAHIESLPGNPKLELEIDRAHVLIRNILDKELSMEPCTCCGSLYVRFKYDLHDKFKCVSCRQLPSITGAKE